jgi:hypothetical protein
MDVFASQRSESGTFTKIYGHKQRWDSKQWVAIDPGPTQAVRLVIQSIDSYRRLWDELSPGMTARLTLTGDGLDRLSEGRILGDDNAAAARPNDEECDNVSTPMR